MTKRPLIRNLNASRRTQVKVDVFDNSIGYDLIAGCLHGPLRKIYFDFLKRGRSITTANELYLAYGRLLRMKGPARAKRLRADKKLRDYYMLKTQRV